MQKWLLVLALALLLNSMHAQAEEDIYFTNNEDRYYHLDENCDRHPGAEWWSETPMEYYEREIYQKKPISEEAALEFDKKACPVCVKDFQPVYLGDHFPEWPFETEPWDLGKVAVDDRDAFYENCPQGYKDELIGTSVAFYDYYEEFYNHESGKVERKHPYPDVYAGCYTCDADCTAYRIVDPDEEIMAAFEHMFGGGAWIVPAKYGYDEIMEDMNRIVQELQAWCKAHPEVDARFTSADGPGYANYAVIEINGADWQTAAAAMEDSAPIYIHFVPEEMIVAMDF